MATRGQIPFEGHSIQSPGMMRHIPYPGVGPGLNHHPLDPLPPVDILEKKMAIQATEMEHLARENQRLAATHGTLRRDLVATQQEMQRVHARMGGIHTEGDIKIKGLLEIIAKMEADLRAGESMKKDLQEAHLEAKALVKSRQELNAEIEKVNQELKKAHADQENLPEMRDELDSLKHEHQRLRAQFEYEKGLNIEQVEQMHAMERNLISVAREVEKLRAEVFNAEKRALAATQYGNAYGSPDPARSRSTTGGGPGGYVDAYGRPQVLPSGVSEEAYGRPPVQMSGVPPEAYGRPQAQGSGANPGEAYGMPQAPMSGSVPLETYGRAQMGGEVPVEGMSPYGGSGGQAVRGAWTGTGPYQAASGAPPPPPPPSQR
ncbi:protein FLX-like 2 [Aristolochia californica]|uniref:protein FLX-like 2 n=1 Tax=Aristolochia californica TaxID=171875 RepID=UPI0035D88C6D